MSNKDYPPQNIKETEEEIAFKKTAMEAILAAKEADMSKEELLARGYPEELIDEVYKEKLPMTVVEQKNKNVVGRMTKLGGKRLEKDKMKMNELKSSITTDLVKIENVKENEELNEKLRGVGLDGKDFEGIPAWGSLSYAQKLLAIEQISQITLSTVKEVGEQKFKEKNTLKRSWNPLKWDIGEMIIKTGANITKSVWISGEEKKAIADFKAGKLKPDAKNVESIVQRMADMDLNVVENGGKPSVEFMKVDEGATEEQKKIIEQYNKIANEYANMPDAWRNERAAASKDGRGWNQNKSENHNAFIAKKAQYEQARNLVLGIKAKQYEASGKSKGEAEEEAKLAMNFSDGSIEMLQYTKTNPDAIAELNRIENEESWGRLLNNENLWKSGLILSGYFARKGFGAISWLAAPIVGGTLGGIRSKRKADKKANTAFLEGRSEKTFREMSVEERMGARKEYDYKRNPDGSIMFDKVSNRPIMKDGTTELPNIYRDKNADKSTFSKVSSGKDVNTKEIAAFVDADSQIQRLNNLIQKLEKAEGEIEKGKISEELSARVEYIEKKHMAGLINYGKEENRIGNNYTLLKLMSGAAVQAYMNRPKGNMYVATPLDIAANKGYIDYEELNKEGDKRSRWLQAIMSKNEAQFGEKEAEFKNNEIKRGIAMGAGLATLGVLIRELGIFGSSVETAGTPGIHHAGPAPVFDSHINEGPVTDNTYVHHDYGINKPIVENTIKTETPAVETPKVTNENVVEAPKVTPKVDVVETPKVTTVETPKVTNENVVEAPKVSKIDIIENSKIPKIVDENVVGDSNPPEIIDEQAIKTDIVNPEIPKIIDEGNVEIPKAPVIEDLNLKEIPKVITPTPINEFEVKAAPDVVMDNNVHPTESNGFNSINEKGNINPRGIPDNVVKAPTPIVESVPGVKIEGQGASIIEQDPKHLVSVNEVPRRFVVIDKPDENITENIKVGDLNKATDAMLDQKGIKVPDYETLTKEHTLQEYFGENDITKNPEQIVYENGKNIKIPEYTSIKQVYFRDALEWNTVNKIPAKYFMQDDFLNGNNISEKDLNLLVEKGIVTQNEVTGVYSFSHHNEIVRLSKTYKHLVSTHKYEKFISNIEKSLGNEKPIGNENIEAYIKRITSKVYKADDGTLYGFKKPSDLSNEAGRPSNYNYNNTNEISPTNNYYNNGGENSISPTNGFYDNGGNLIRSTNGYYQHRYGIVPGIVDNILNNAINKLFK